MQKKLFSLFAILAIFIMATGATLAQNSDKADPPPTPVSSGDTTPTDTTTIPDNDANNLSLPMLFDGETITDSMGGEISAKLYVFNATEGDVVTIAMTQLSEELDPYIVLLGSAGQVLMSDDDSGKTNLSALIEGITLPQTGSYFLLASTFYTISGRLDNEQYSTVLAGDALDYTLSVSGITPPADTERFNDNLYRYFVGRLTNGETSTGASTLAEPVYFWTYDAEAGDKIDVELVSTEFDTVLHLFADGGDRVQVNDDDATLGGTDSAIRSFTVPATGRYLFFATDLFFISSYKADSLFEGGQFSITVRPSSAPSAPNSK